MIGKNYNFAPNESTIKQLNNQQFNIQ